MDLSQVIAASAVTFCFGLSALGGVGFEKERDIRGRGNYQKVFNYVLINVLLSQNCKGKAEAAFPC